MKLFYIFILLLFIKIFSYYPIYGVNIYLSVDGQDQMNCGNQDNPCFSFSYVATQFGSMGKLDLLMMPGFYDFTNLTVAQFTNTQLSIKGVYGQVRTQIKIPIDGNTLNFIDSVVDISNIQFSNNRNINNINGTVEDDGDFYLESINADISLTKSFLTLNNVIVFNNSNFNMLKLNQSTLLLNNCVIQLNRYDQLINSYYSHIIFNRTKIISNSFQTAMVSSFSDVFFNQSIFIYNYSIYGMLFFASPFESRSSLFIENNAVIGLFVGLGSKIRVAKSIFKKNTAISTSSIAFLDDISVGEFILDIFEDNYSTGSSIAGSSSQLLIFDNSWFNSSSRISVFITIYAKGQLYIYGCAFSNIYGILLSSDSSSIIVVINTVFSFIQGRIFETYGLGNVLFASIIFDHCGSFDHLNIIANQVTVFMYDIRVFESSVATFILTDFNSYLVFIKGYFYDNHVLTSIISAKNGYILYMNGCIFFDTTGFYNGATMELDLTGNVTVFNTKVASNQSPFGPFIYFVDSNVYPQNCINNLFANITFFNNLALTSGSLVYYSSDLYCPFQCFSCISSNNTAVYGDLINSDYYNFTVFTPSVISTPLITQVVITALDQFGQRYRGRTDVIFELTYPNCSNINITGIKQVVLNLEGLPIMYNLQISALPNSSCDLVFQSSPPAVTGDLIVTIHTMACEDDEMAYQVDGLYYCLRKTGLSDITKISITAAAAVVLVVTIACFVLVIIYRHNRLINYSNPYFLLTNLIGCMILLVSVVPQFIVTDFSCILRPILTPLGYYFAALSVIVKQWSIWRKRKELNFQSKRMMETNYFFKRLAILFIIPIFVVVLNVAITRDKPTYNTETEYDFTIEKVCYAKLDWIYIITFLVYLVLLLLLCSILVYLGRQYRSSPGTFNEPTYIGILIYNYILLIIILIPLRFSFPSSTTANFLVVSIISIVFVICTISILFVPKFYLLFRKQKVLLTMMKFIEEQENQLERNKDVLQFYEIYGDQHNDNHNFANRNIFTPDVLSPLSLSSADLPKSSNNNNNNITDNNSNNNNNHDINHHSHILYDFDENLMPISVPLRNSSNGQRDDDDDSPIFNQFYINNINNNNNNDNNNNIQSNNDNHKKVQKKKKGKFRKFLSKSTSSLPSPTSTKKRK